MSRKPVSGLFSSTTTVIDFVDHVYRYIVKDLKNEKKKVQDMSQNVDQLEKRIEVVEINDKCPEPPQPITPHERQVVDAVIAIWKEDPSTESLGVPKLHSIVKEKHPNWSLSEKRVRALLKKFGLMPTANVEQYTYAKDITSLKTPHVVVPDKLTLQMTSKRGKGLFAKTEIKEGELIWEEAPLFLVPLLAHAELITNGKACSFCGKISNDASRSKAGLSVLRGIDCSSCPETWCSSYCKRVNQTQHSALKHVGRSSIKQFDAEAFHSLVEFAIKEQWNALYATTLIFADILLDKSNVKGDQFKAMARVDQRIRYKALNSSAGAFDSMQGGALFVEEQQEQLWKKGYELFCDVFPRSRQEKNLLYDEFMFMMGTYNINNVDSCIFLLQSHLNHNCDPNTKVVLSAKKYEKLKVFAARDIRTGEELTTTYVNPSHTVQQRQRELRVNWGFICKCQKCKSDFELQKKRKSSSSKSLKDKADVKAMLDSVSKELEGKELELQVPLDYNGERRKSVRFDEKVIKLA